MKGTFRMELQLFAKAPEGGAAAAEDTAVHTAPQTEQEEVQQRKARLEELHRRFFSHFQDLERQSEELKTTFPGFDLRQELRDPVFSRLTSPAVGLSVEDAYYTVHRKALQSAAVQAAVQAAARQITSTIASGARRPRENGLSGQAPAVSHFDYRSATREQREDLKRRIRLAAAEGKKIYPGR